MTEEEREGSGSGCYIAMQSNGGGVSDRGEGSGAGHWTATQSTDSGGVKEQRAAVRSYEGCEHSTPLKPAPAV